MSISIGGHSSRNFISINSLKNRATAYRQDDGTIKVQLGKIDEKDSDELLNKFSRLEIAVLVLFIVLFVVSLFVKEYKIIPLMDDKKIAKLWYLVPMALCAMAVFFMILMLRKYGGERALKNHGAEHTVIIAYEKLRRIPTIEECKSFPRIIDNCGVTIYSALITGQFFGFIIYCFTGKAISEILLAIVPLFFGGHAPFNWLGKFLQHFTTSKPDEENIELAIAALSAVVNMENG